jgi:type IV secretory pathway TraG/TraD family ATPase VirD4
LAPPDHHRCLAHPSCRRRLRGAIVVVLGVIWLRRGRTVSLVNRWAARNRRTSGVATSLDIARTASAWAMRRQARVLRPSLADLPRRELRKVPTTQYAVRLVRVGHQTAWASVRDVVTIFGGPGTGKTAMLGGILIDAPGAAVVTSTRLDLLDNARALRERVGPIYLFNPGGLGDLQSDLGFDPLIDCESPVDATERAIDMIPIAKGRGGEAERWDAQGRRVLAALLHAAALGETLDGRPRTMDHVLGWVSDPDAAKTEVTRLLRKSSQAAFVPAAIQFVTTNDRTRSSVTSTIMPALQWLLSPSAVAATRPRDGAPPLDVAQLLRERATVYVLGRDEANTAALLAAFNGYDMRAARRLAGGKRLDPPPFLILDEAGRVAPVPLDDWTGDAGGSGIVIAAAFQSRADVVDRWGPSGASKILNNSGAAVLLGGTKDNDDLEQWSRLAGNRDEVVKTYDSKGRLGSRSVRQVPVLPTSQLAALPKGHAVVFRTGMRPVIGRTERVWERADVRAAMQRAAFERTLDAAWRATWVADGAGVVVDAAEKFARSGEAPPTERASYARPAAGGS